MDPWLRTYDLESAYVIPLVDVIPNLRKNVYIIQTSLQKNCMQCHLRFLIVFVAILSHLSFQYLSMDH
jgi:hypothetical protein